MWKLYHYRFGLRGRIGRTGIPVFENGKHLFFFVGSVLGLGINGKVVECRSKGGSDKYALKMLRDNPKARREVELHWKSSQSCRNIVR